MRIIILIAALLLALQGSTQTFNPEKLDSLLTDLFGKDLAMGSLAIRQEGKLVFNKAYGYADIAGRQAANADTRYRIGSITKMFTAAMILQLVAEDKLTLGTHLSRFFPNMPNAEKITIRQMLNHHSGIHNFTNDPEYVEIMEKEMNRKDMMAIMEAQQPEFEPGTKGEYSNSNYVLLGYIIEDLTRLPYSEALQQRVCEPIGLENTYYGAAADPGRNEAYSYYYSNEDNTWKKNSETNMAIPHGAGAIVSTPADLTRFIEALFSEQVVDEIYYGYMMDFEDEYGLGIFHFPFYGREGYGHNGGIDAFESNLAYFPAERTAIA